MFSAARYRSQVANPETRYYYFNWSASDKLFNTFVRIRMDSSDQIEFIIEKQVGETDSEEFYKLQTEGYGKSDDRVSKSEQQRGGGTDRLQRESRKSQYKINLNKQHQD